MRGKGKPKPKSRAIHARVSAAKSSARAKPRVASKAKAATGDWRTATVARMRELIVQADPGVVEEIKWRKPSNAMQGVPVWSHDGILCTGETYNEKVKFTFAQGALLPDPTGLFNADDRGSTRRAIDLREGDAVDASAFKELVKAAVTRNTAGR